MNTNHHVDRNVVKWYAEEVVSVSVKELPAYKVTLSDDIMNNNGRSGNIWKMHMQFNSI